MRLLEPPAPSPPKGECVGLPEGIARGSRERLLRPFHDVWASSRIPPLRELPSSLPFPRSNSELLLVLKFLCAYVGVDTGVRVCGRYEAVQDASDVPMGQGDMDLLQGLVPDNADMHQVSSSQLN